MNYDDKTREELIAELEELRLDYNSLKLSCNKKSAQNNLLKSELAIAKQQVEESETQFKNIFNSAADAIFIADKTTGVIIDLNQTAEKLMQMPKEKIIGMHQSKLHPKEAEKYTLKSFKEHQQGVDGSESDIFIENKIVCSNGSQVPVEILASKTIYKGKECLIGTFRDITKRKKAEEKLRESEEKNTALLNATMDMAMLLDKNGLIISINKAMANSLGVSSADVIGRSVFDLLPVKIGNERRKAGEKAAKFKRAERIIDRRDNRWFESCIYPILDEKEEVHQFALFTRDITEFKLADEALKNSEHRFKTLSSIATEGLMIHENGIVLDANLAFAKLIGYANPEDLIGKNAFEISPLTPDSRMAVKESMNKNSKETYDITLIDKSGELIQAQTRAAEIIYKGRNARLVYMQDISERKKVELELIKSKERAEESDRLKTAFLQNMSHEIRTPMNAIMGFSGLLAENYDDKQTLDQYAEIIKQRCADLLEIINGILDISMIESGQLTLDIEECNINELFNELNIFFKEYQKRIGKDHIRLSILPQNLMPNLIVQTDKVKLKQVLINLISNALKFTEAGYIECGYKLSNNNLEFYVSDTGVGIPKEKQEEVFNRFSQLRHPKLKMRSGTGLGLSIAKGLTELMGGKMWLESTIENHAGGIPGGSTFSFCINCIQSNIFQQKDKAEIETQEVKFNDNTILIVEDDYYNAEYLRAVLSKTGINILEAQNGYEAIEIAKNQIVDIILMDIRLPDLNGYEVTQIIRKSKPEINIIAQTAYAAHDEKNKAIDAGCIDYISKPTNRGLLISLISRYLNIN